MSDIEWFDEFDEDDYEEIPVGYYQIFWPPAPMETSKWGWASRRFLRVDAHEDEAYVYWELEMDAITKAAWASRLARVAFTDVNEWLWGYIPEILTVTFTEDE